MSSIQTNVEALKQLYDALIELRKATKELESSEVVGELDKKFEQLENTIEALSDFAEQNPRMWRIEVYDDNEIAVTHIHADVMAVIEGDWSMTISDVLRKFFDDNEFVNKIIKSATEIVSEIVSLIRRNADIYTRIAKLNGRIDQLYYDVKKLCPQRDP